MDQGLIALVAFASLVLGHRVATLPHPPFHALHGQIGAAHIDVVKPHLVARRFGLAQQINFRRVRKRGLGSKILARCHQLATPLLGQPLAGFGFFTGQRGITVMRLRQEIGVDEFRMGKTRPDFIAVEGRLARPVGASKEVKEGLVAYRSVFG